MPVRAGQGSVIPFPTIPDPTTRYERDNEAQFRQSIERVLRNLSDVVTGATLDDTIDALLPLSAENGGTGLDTYAIGDLIVATGVTTLSRLGIGTATKYLRSDGTTPGWSNIPFSELTGTPTTLAGYGITDAYTKTQVDALLDALDFGDIDGTIANAQVPASAVTQHQAALSIGWAQLTGVPSTFTPSAHTHPPADLTGFGAAAGYLRSNGSAWVRVSGVDYADLTGVPSTFTPTAHTHALADITGFGAAGGYIRSTGSAWARTSGVAYTDLTYSGLTAGHALVASSATAAAFRALTAADIGAGTFGTGDFVFPANVSINQYLQVDADNIHADDLGPSPTTPIVANGRIQSNRYNNPGQMAVTRTNGSIGARTAVLDTEQMGTMVAGGFDGTALGVHSSFVYRAAENWSSTAHGFKIQFITVTAGTTTAANRMEIDENGNVIAPGIATSAAIATNATNGFLYTSACSGTPTGTPTAMTSAKPVIIDQTNDAFYFNASSVWHPLFTNRFVTLTYSATIATDAALGSTFGITVTNGTAFTMSAPTHPIAGQRLAYIITNSSGGVMGAITWNAAFKLAGAFTNPASTKTRTIEFRYNGTSWFEVCRAAADI